MVAPPIVVVAIPAHRAMVESPIVGIAIEVTVMIAVVIVALRDGYACSVGANDKAEALRVRDSHRSANQSQRDDCVLEEVFHGSLLLLLRQSRVDVAQTAPSPRSAARGPQKTTPMESWCFMTKRGGICHYAPSV